MDINVILHFIPAQIEKIIGTLAALFILTTIWLLIRSLKEGPADEQVDVSSIEDALKRVLHQTSITTRSASLDDLAAAGSNGMNSRASGANGDSRGNPATEKDQQIAELQSALEQAQVLLTQNSTKSADGELTFKLGEPGELDKTLFAEMDELKARLAEYEIIEDDIADLALYREENARLKLELDNLKVSAATEIAASEAEMERAMSTSLAADASVSPEAPVAVVPVDAFESEDLMSEFKADPESEASATVDIQEKKS